MLGIRTETPIMTNEIYHQAPVIYLYHDGHDFAWSDVEPAEYLRDLDEGHCWLLGVCECKHWDDPNYVYDSHEFNPLNTLTMTAETRNKLIQVMTNLMVDIGDLDDIHEKGNYQLYTCWWLKWLRLFTSYPTWWITTKLIYMPKRLRKKLWMNLLII